MTYPRRHPAWDFAPALCGAATGVLLGWAGLVAVGWWVARKALRVGR